jgi:hypothetical protein
MASINASTSGAGGVITTADATGILNLQTAGTNAVTINASQNVFMGNSGLISGTSSSPRLYVVGTTPIVDSGAGGQQLIVTSSETSGGDKGGVIGLAGPSAGAGVNIKATIAGKYDSAVGGNAGYMQFATIASAGDLVERMRIDSSGNVMMGITSAGGKLTVAAALQNGIELRTTDTADGIYGLYNTGGSSGTAVYVMPCRFGSTNTFAGGVYWSGSVMQYTGTSDFRLKENIVDSGSGLEKLANIKVRSFDWKESGLHVDFGVIAQELEEIAPEAVAKGRDNEDGSINTPYAVDTSILVPAMIKAIQEQQTIINDLTARIETLEAK